MSPPAAIQDDHMINDVAAVYAAHGRNSGSPFADDLRYSQTGTAGALHNFSLWRG
jgi:hypothetical protein